MKTKGQAMVMRINVLRYNRFVFRHELPLLLEKTGPICLALVGLMAGWLAGRLADEVRTEVEIFKFPMG